MIRDLRAAPPQMPASTTQALAFSRGAITDPNAHADALRTRRAFTIAVTAPRLITCKRGFAAHLAVQLGELVRAEGATTCVVDADVESRDIGVRFGVDGPVLLDIAKRVAVTTNDVHVEDLITRLDQFNLSVLPTQPPQPALLPLLRTKTAALLGPLATGFDFVVIDAPVGLGVDTHELEWDRSVLQQVDALVVAVAADPASFGSALRYLSALVAAIARGALPSTFEISMVLTGSEADGSRTLLAEHELDRKLEGLPIIGSVPQLWGRQRPNGLVAQLDGALQERLTGIARRITGYESA
jgi:MinD-like ATPase involved in chromosome partitioning or flagellar assembly